MVAAILVLGGPGANAMLLDYSAYLGDTKVGEAQVKIDVAETGYQIKGRAQSTGLMGLFSKWKSLFTTSGFFSFGKPVASAYQVTEEAGGKNKHIVYAGEKVYVTKNGKSRAPMPLPADTDFWSLLFLSEDCGEERVVHDGKDLWQVKPRVIENLPEGGQYCEFEVVDEDLERSVASVWLQQIGGLTVPVQVELQGAMHGTFKLTDHVLD
jgi:hypothetical protein